MTLRPATAGDAHREGSRTFDGSPGLRSNDLRSSLRSGLNTCLWGEARPRVLVADHQDSFVHNLARYFHLLGCDVTVRRSYKLEPARVREEGFRLLVLSPGPRRPHDEPQSLALVRELAGIVPILGVCLGHQIIAQAFGAAVVESSSPCHGRGAWVRYVPHPCFAGIPNPFFAGRYHSLTVAADSLPDRLLPIAWTGDGHLMAICHRRFAVVGWQFHPESILTPMGLRLIRAFLSYAGIYERTASPEITCAGGSC